MLPASLSTASDECLFRAFQQQRNCEALGVLFRRRAAELLRLAVFVAASPSDAEDLVQATFLCAITRAETFHDGGRVMSWLCGILTNQARMLRRASRRKPPATAATASVEPVNSALQAELRAALEEGIASLPEPYHSVLSLHLQGGLDSHEIAQRLARPPATVRKQMERAIERLRRALPLGLATGVVLRLSPEAMAQNAADAARYGEYGAVEPAAGPTAHTMPSGWSMGIAAAALLVAIGALAVFGRAWLPLAVSSSRVAAMAPPGPISGIADAPPTGSSSGGEAPSHQRSAASATSSLQMVVHGRDGVVWPGLDMVAVRLEERSLAERLLVGEVHRATTDAAGVAAFESLEPGSYQVMLPGSGSTVQVAVMTGVSHADMVVAPPLRCRGKVVDDRGAPVADAELLASTSAARTDPASLIGRTGRDGTFDVTVQLASGSLFARHAAFTASLGCRLEADRELRLVLGAAGSPITVTTVDPSGQPLAGCYVALVPRSAGDEYLLSQHGCTDAAGCFTFADPGTAEVAVVASRRDRAATILDLPGGTRTLVVPLDAGGVVAGQALDLAGKPLANRAVQAGIASQRSKDPAPALVMRRVTTGADGTFEFSHLPAGTVQLQILALPPAPGLRAAAVLEASSDVQVRAGEVTQVALRSHPNTRMVGRLTDPARTGLGGWMVVAAPDTGTAWHRVLRTRTAICGADGTFSLDWLAPGDAYHLGVFPPAAIGGRAMPHATVRAAPGSTALGDLIVDPLAAPRGQLVCRITDPVGRAIPAASIELRSLAFQVPTVKSSDVDGRCRFDGLLPGEYWLAVNVAGAGSRTIAAVVGPDMSTVDLGDQVVEPAARVALVVSGVARTGLHVVLRHGIGDKYVEATTDAAGRAQLPPVPPGPVQLLVHGPGMAPQRRHVELVSGAQEIVVEGQPAPRVAIDFLYGPADNPFTVQGPLQVQVFDGQGVLLFEDYVGGAVAPGRFELATGLPPGAYRLQARSIWNAATTASFAVADTGTTRVTTHLRR